jgi:hypothetical protein
MKLPSVYPLTIPSSQRMIRMIAIVSSIGLLLRAVTGGATEHCVSNGCATPVKVRQPHAVLALVIVLLGFGTVSRAAAQTTPEPPPAPSATSSEHPASSLGSFLAGAAIGLAAHESGHLLFDALFSANPRVKKVSFHGVPFFAITHDSGLPPHQEFVIDSAGFWVQQLGNEIVLTRRPNLRREDAPLVKGLVAFNVLASVAYSGAAFARTGPVERDTRGMADSLNWKEPVVGALILAPAVLDAIRYFHPDARWAKWGSRDVKVGMVLLVGVAK